MKAGTLRQWVMVASPAMRERYWVARRLWGSALADEAVEIARESVNASSTVDKLKIDTFLRLAGKANPQEYGDKQVVEHQGTQKLEIVVREEAKPVRQISASAVLGEVQALGNGGQAVLVLDGAVEEAYVGGVPFSGVVSA
jgi:hypothetical protein